MFDYINGIITDIKSNSIVVENNGIGYLVYVSNPYSFELNNEYKVYIYQQITEDSNNLYGFKSIDEKDLFLKLISVKGLGCKMALPILAVGSIDGIKDAIERENILYIKKFPKIGDKLAKQIILDLKGKVDFSVEENKNSEELKNLSSALKALGYSASEIKTALKNFDIKEYPDLGAAVKAALKKLTK